MTAGKIRASRPFLNHTGPKHPFIGMQMFLREAQSHDNQYLAGETIPRHMGIISPEQTANQSFAPNKPAKKIKVYNKAKESRRTPEPEAAIWQKSKAVAQMWPRHSCRRDVSS